MERLTRKHTNASEMHRSHHIPMESAISGLVVEKGEMPILRLSLNARFPLNSKHKEKFQTHVF